MGDVDGGGEKVGSPRKRELAGHVPRPDPEEDALYAALADARRRFVISAVATVNESLGVDELARAMESGDITSTGEDAWSLSVGLHHNHLPKLSEYELIEYDRESDQVRPSDRTAACHDLITMVHNRWE